MALTAWQIDRIRQRFVNYLDREGSSSRALPLQSALSRMEECPAIDESLFSEAKGFAIKHEALRRWVAETQSLAPEKVNAIKQFLIAEAILSEEELADDFGDDGELQSMVHFLANRSLDVERAMGNLRPRYSVIDDRRTSVESIELRFEVDPSGTFLRVEEFFTATTPSVHLPIEEKSRFARHYVRRGYGFMSTSLDLLHLFVCGGNRSDRVHYIEVDGRPEYDELKVFRAGDRAASRVVNDAQDLRNVLIKTLAAGSLSEAEPAALAE